MLPDWRCCSSAALLRCRPTLPHRRCVVASSLRCPSPRSATGTPLRFARTRVAAHRRTASSALRCVARAPLHCSAAFKRRCLRRRTWWQAAAGLAGSAESAGRSAILCRRCRLCRPCGLCGRPVSGEDHMRVVRPRLVPCIHVRTPDLRRRPQRGDRSRVVQRRPSFVRQHPHLALLNHTNMSTPGDMHACRPHPRISYFTSTPALAQLNTRAAGQRR